jgi:hypothetical protein
MAARKAGRTSKLTPELQAEIVNLLKMGVLIVDVCDYVGIDNATYHRWAAVGRAYRIGDDHQHMPRLIADRERYGEFYDSTTRARKEATIGCVNTLRIASQTVTKRVRNSDTGEMELEIVKQGDIQAAEWYLERSNPAKWGKRTYLKMEGLEQLIRLAKELGHKPETVIADVVAVLEEERRERLQ